MASLCNKLKEQAGKNGTLIAIKEEAEGKDLDMRVQVSSYVIAAWL